HAPAAERSRAEVERHRARSARRRAPRSAAAAEATSRPRATNATTVARATTRPHRIHCFRNLSVTASPRETSLPRRRYGERDDVARTVTGPRSGRFPARSRPETARRRLAWYL